MTSSDREALIAELRHFPETLSAAVSHLTDDQLTTAYIADEWTVAQIVHHIVDSHMNSYVRCKLMATEDHPALRAFDEKLWAGLPDGASADIENSLAMVRALHGRWADFWDSLNETEWQRTGYHASGRVVTLKYQLELYVQHGRNHLQQIADTLMAGGLTGEALG